MELFGKLGKFKSSMKQKLAKTWTVQWKLQNEASIFQ